METNIEDLIKKAESGNDEAQYTLALYYINESEKNGVFLRDAMYWLGKVSRHNNYPKNYRKNFCNLMDSIRLCVIKVNIEMVSDNNDLYKDEIENFISMTSDKVDAFIEDCKQKKILRPQHYMEVSEDGNSSSIYYFVSPFPVSIKNKGFKESLVAHLTKTKATELWNAGYNDKAYAYLDVFWKNLVSWDYRWIVNEGLTYLETKAAWYVEEQKWDMATIAYLGYLRYRNDCDISQFAKDDEDIFEGMTEKEQRELCYSEFSCYNTYVSLAQCYLQQEKTDETICIIAELYRHFKTRIERQDSWLTDWLLEQFKNENKQEKYPNLINILKNLSATYVWEYCYLYCSFLEAEMDKNGVGNGYNWTRKQYDLIETMFESVIPHMEQNIEDYQYKQILAILNLYKGKYMMQTRRFVLAEKQLLNALSLFKELIMAERTNNISLLAETIESFVDLYRVQNQKAKKQDYLWNLMDLFQENEKSEDYYLSLKEKLEQK